jgi:hypothetical protein
MWNRFPSDSSPAKFRARIEREIKIYIEQNLYTRALEQELLTHPVLNLYYRRMYPKVSGLAAWSENCKWYSSLPLYAVVSLFCELV